MNSDVALCRVENLSHHYGSRAALTNVSFTISPGIVAGLVGANGSGKSTLLRILSGVQRPSSGAIHLFGEDLSSAEGAGRGLGAAVDGMALWPSWSVLRNLHYIAGLCGASKHQIQDAAELVGIDHEMHTRIRRLSLGNRQRVLLAAAVIAGTDLVLMDEPMNGLDPDARQHMRQAIVMMAGQGRSVLLSSHDLHDVESLCGQLLLLDRGHLAFEGPIDEFMGSSTMTTFHLDSTCTDRAHIILAEAGFQCRRDGGGLVVFTHDADAAAQALKSAGIPVLTTDERRATLEEKFHDL